MSRDVRIIFLDIDGVLNCQTFYTHSKRRHEQYPLSEICPERIELLNDLCRDIGAKVVISSSWRHGREIDEMRTMLQTMGAAFDIIDYTPTLDMRFKGAVRGNDIKAWIEDNANMLGCYSHQYKTYAIIDDDSDMLLWQRENFFQTDSYSGLTPNICHRIKLFFEQTTNIVS